MAPVLSIIVVNWNNRRLLEECLDSIRRQPPAGSYETIVVDNASTDGSVTAVRQKYPEVKVVANQQNLGFSKANNLGLKASQGEFILFLNNDAQVKPGSLDLMIDYLKRHPRVGAVGGQLVTVDGRPDLSWGNYPSPWRDLLAALGLAKISQAKIIRRVDYISGADLLARRQALEAVGGFDERFFLYCEDAELGLSLKKAGWESVFLPAAIFLHHKGQSFSRPSELVFSESRRGRLLFYRKHYGRLRVWSGRLVLSAIILARLGLIAAAKVLRHRSFLDRQPSLESGFYYGVLGMIWRT